MKLIKSFCSLEFISRSGTLLSVQKRNRESSPTEQLGFLELLHGGLWVMVWMFVLLKNFYISFFNKLNDIC